MAATPPVDYRLASLVRNAGFGGQHISYLTPLFTANDSVVAGNAMRAVAQTSKVPLNTLVRLDRRSSANERMTYFVAAMIMQDNAARKNSLKYLADKLQSTQIFGTSSPEFHSACAINQEADVYGQNIFNRNDISSANKIMLGLTAPTLKAPAASMAQAIFRDVKETAKLASERVDIEFLSLSLGLTKPSFTIGDFGRYTLEQLEAVAKYINFDSVPREALVGLRARLEAGADRSQWYALSTASIKELFKRGEYDPTKVGDDWLNTIDYIDLPANPDQQATIDFVYDRFTKLLRNQSGRPQYFETRAPSLAVQLVKAGKPKDLLSAVYDESPFWFLVNLDKAAKLDRQYVVDTLNRLLQSNSLTPLETVMLAISAGVDSDCVGFAQEAFNEAVNKMGKIEETELRERPGSYQGDVDTPLLILSLLTESTEFRTDVTKLRTAVQALGLVPARGNGVVLRLSSGGSKLSDQYGKLAGTLVPEAAAAIKSTRCAGRVYNELIRSDQLKELIWSAVLD